MYTRQLLHSSSVFHGLFCFVIEEPQNSDGEEEDIYNNTVRDLVQSEGIPVERLEWYNKSNMEAILEQYEVCVVNDIQVFLLKRYFI